jgi:hypothetical protein
MLRVTNGMHINMVPLMIGTQLTAVGGHLNNDHITVYKTISNKNKLLQIVTHQRLVAQH